MKKQRVKQVLLFLPIIYSIPLLSYDDALPMMVESFHVDVQSIHYIYASSVSILSLFVCMFTYHITFSFFLYHFIVHHGTSTLLLDAAPLWLLIVLSVFITYQPLGSPEEPTCQRFYVTVLSYIMICMMKYDYYVVVSFFVPVITMPQCQPNPIKCFLPLDGHMNCCYSLRT